jgi:hypothetical protein
MSAFPIDPPLNGKARVPSGIPVATRVETRAKSGDFPVGCGRDDGQTSVMQQATDGSQPTAAWQRVETLGVAQIVVLILEARKTMPWATAATVSRERHDEAFRIRVCLLKGTPQADQADQADQAAALGKVIADFTVGRLDTDLTDAFGDKDVITLT